MAIHEPNKHGVSTSSNAYAIDCKNTLLRSESKEQVIVGLNVNDILAISTPDAVLIAHKNKAQNVKKVLTTLKKENVHQTDTFQKFHRPWGWFEILTSSKTFQIKKYMLNLLDHLVCKSIYIDPNTGLLCKVKPKLQLIKNNYTYKRSISRYSIKGYP